MPVLLKNFMLNPAALADGEWLSLGEEFDDAAIKAKPFNDAYANARAQKMRRLAANYGGDERRIPTEKTRDVIVDCLKQFCIQGVRGIDIEPGKPITLDQFVDVLRQPEGGQWLTAVVNAVSRAGTAVDEDEATAAGN
jgi:hypothetical protein